MAKRAAYLHIGPDIPGLEASHEALRGQRALARARVVVPDVSQEDMERADVEIRRLHRTAGLRRKDVEGAWAHVCRRVFKARSDVLISQPGFVEAEYRHVALALDGLVGLQVHLVVTPPTPLDEAELAALVEPWDRFVRKPHRIHVLPGLTPDLFAGALARTVLVGQADAVERRMTTLTKRRLKLTRRLGRVDAA